MNKDLFNNSRILNTTFSLFNISSKPDDSIKDIKAGLLKIILDILNILGIPAIIAAIILAIKLSQFETAIGYFLFYLPILAAYFLRKKAKYTLPVLLLLLSNYLIAIGDLLTYGIMGLAPSIFLIIFVLTSIFFDFKSAIISIIISTITIAIFGYLYTYNILIIEKELFNMLNHPFSWISVTLVIIFMGIIIIASFGFIQYKMTEKIILANQQSLELEKDIEKRKFIEEKLQKAKDKAEESQLKFTAITEQTNEGISLVTLAGDYVFVNPVFCKMTGYTQEELLKMNTTDLRVSDRDKGGFQKSINGAEGNMIEIELLKKDKTTFWSEITGKKIKIANDMLALGVVRDITQKRNAEISLKKSELRLTMALQASASGIWDWNIQTGEMYFDSNYFTISGYQPYEFESNYNEWKERVHPDDITLVESEIRAYLNKEIKEYRVEFRFKTKENKWMWILGKGKVFEYDINGKPSRFTGTHTDITSTKIAEKALIAREKELSELNATKDKFFSIISHDLKSPLSSIFGFTELLSRKYEIFSEDEKKKAIEVLKNTSENSFKLLENLLEWSRAQTDSIDFNLEQFNILELANSSMDLIKLSSTQKEIKLRVNAADDFAVYADKNMISTVFRNLLSNAIKYTAKGGAINIDIIEKTDNNAKKHIKITVTDNGIGIEKENVDKLFKISETVRTKGIEGEKGTGLGLILCKEFIKKNGGKIWVESEIGKGSKFIFTLKKA